jgi:hypothetical protein
MLDIPSLIQNHLVETVNDDVVLANMLRWLRSIVKATKEIQATDLKVAEGFNEVQKDYCTYCQIEGNHHRGNCPELAATAVAAPLVVCPHPSTKVGRLGQLICTDCGENIQPTPKKSTFGFQ